MIPPTDSDKPLSPDNTYKIAWSIDFILLFSVIGLLAIGLLGIVSSTSYMAYINYNDKLYFVKRQLLYLVIGLSLLYIVKSIHYNNYNKIGLFLFIISLILLVMVLIPHIGTSIRGARRWLRFGPLSFSPTPLAEISLILYLSHYLSKNYSKLSKPSNFIMPYAILLIPVLLIYFQPNLGSAVLCVAIGSFIIYVGGGRLFYIFVFYLLYTLINIFLLLRNPKYLSRVTSYLDPWLYKLNTGYQLKQSIIALGSGGIVGVGFGQGVQRLFYLPDIHTTFILSHIGEEFGFLGTFILISLLAIFIYRGLLIAFRIEDRFGKLLAFGITFGIGIKSLMNISVLCGMVPTMGIDLPFVSYGGTSLCVNLISLGILLNISKNTKHYYVSYRLPSISLKLKNIYQYIVNLSNKIESHPIYKIVAYVALFLTVLVSIIQIIKWLWYN